MISIQNVQSKDRHGIMVVKQNKTPKMREIINKVVRNDQVTIICFPLQIQAKIEIIKSTSRIV